MEKGDGGEEGVSVCVVVHDIYFIMDMEEPEPTIFFPSKEVEKKIFWASVVPYVDVLCGGGVPNFLKRRRGVLMDPA